MIWFKALGIMCAGFVGLCVIMIASAWLEDFMVSRFGKPPTWVAIFNAIWIGAMILVAIKRSIS